MLTMSTLVLTFVVFLALSGMMAAVDAAVLSVTRPEIDELIQRKRPGAKQLFQVKLRLSYAVVVIVVVTNTINVLGPVLISHQAFQLFAARGVVIVTIALTLGTIVFAEILPKALGSRFAPLIARVSAPPIILGQKIMYPLVVSLAWLTELLTPGNRRIGTEPQIRSLVRIGSQAGHIRRAEEKLIHRAFRLNDRCASEIMTPIAEVRAIAASSSIMQAASELKRSEFSRYPVFGATIDDVQGIVLSRDVFKAVIANDTAQSLLSLAKPPLIVPANDRSDDLLVTFLSEHLHLAVVQTNGRSLGIVTLEDVLEELVGRIDDEKDVT